ncbi:hypothetical protein [Rubrobacter radiotolerans]|uniref:hypothetical protein n=1 Tax=Rubrobacter radiotolerans TaxID=42256 RepID=UPI00056E326F|nr:hypothetical protein [Rubrobacter radiotolerans]
MYQVGTPLRRLAPQAGDLAVGAVEQTVCEPEPETGDRVQAGDERPEERCAERLRALSESLVERRGEWQPAGAVGGGRRARETFRRMEDEIVGEVVGLPGLTL